MNIAFDAKRAFQNTTGLGHYSRTLITWLAKGYPQHQYYLAAPKLTSLYDHSALSNVHDLTPSGVSKFFASAWRSKSVVKDLQKLGVDLYHGLSAEIPVGIRESGIRSVVTIHDLIFERYPHQYSKIDLQIYRSKSKYACHNTSRIIAISEQTKEDIIHYYAVKPDKVDVCYQSCNEIYQHKVSEEEKRRVRAKYSLPGKYFLSVGSVIERKNLLTICKAMHLLQRDGKENIPLVVIGKGGRYFAKVKEYIHEKQLGSLVIFLDENEAIANDADYKSSADFPAIYQLATALIYPSLFEGFGIPILEALWSGLPVITSNQSCMPETGGDAAFYVNPLSAEDMAAAMLQVSTHEGLRRSMIEKGYVHAKKFTPEACAAQVMEVYKKVMAD
ncbi:glycosyltransferase family 4 protein [Polluticoccus soli]|uniref:glycosyltransferase family 4 protein n=1 Tax=Polluticoccus soli TaxID=3034150 RepID=UPI0023E1426E|nr:glycosyltransferase family 1 protein [Flavipsychrobacter sp. JY13-12]